MTLQQFRTALTKHGFKVISCTQENEGGGDIEFENGEGSYFRLWIDGDGILTSGECSSINGGDDLDFCDLHMSEGDKIADFPFDDLKDW